MPLRSQINKESAIAFMALAGIFVYLSAHFIFHADALAQISLIIVLVLGGIPYVYQLFIKLIKGQFSSDLLAGISIVTSAILGEYLAGTIVVLMLSGGEALENYAMRRASAVLEALSKRLPNIAHRKRNGQIEDVKVEEIAVGDECIIFPHEICPVDGLVTDGRGSMDESYLTGEPFFISKTIGAEVISGAVNGEAALTIRAVKLAQDSRFAKIMQVMSNSQQLRPQMRRLGDRLGAWYTPAAVLIAVAAAVIGGDVHRFLAVIVIATPCPLLIAIPVAIIGAISKCAQRGIIIRDPAILEQIDECQVIILDKTGTLTYGQPVVTEINCFNGFDERKILQLTASLEQYSKHPLAGAVIERFRDLNLNLLETTQISERPGDGLRGVIDGKALHVTGRNIWLKANASKADLLPAVVSGLECILEIDGELAAVIHFHDKPRKEGRFFVEHLKPSHKIEEVLIVSGDRETEVRYLADQMGIKEIYAGQEPEQKVDIVRERTKSRKTIYIGDGINDAPALLTATVGIAFGQNSDITSQAAGAVVLESSLRKVDELFHIAHQMRVIALQSAVGGMLLSVAGMFFAAFGFLTPVAGALCQEVIDLAAVLNALRVVFIGKKLSDF